MKAYHLFSFLFLVSITQFPGPSDAQIPQLINYQGRLAQGTNLFNGNAGITLRLFTLPSGGTSIYEDSNNVAVADGIYSTFLGDNTTTGSLAVALANPQVWLEVVVNGSTLSPRERVASVAYALQAWSLSGNSGTSNPSQFIGTTDASAMDFRVDNYRALRLQPGEGANNSIIGGAYNNVVRTNARAGTIAGGGTVSCPNRVEDDWGTVGGGLCNWAGSFDPNPTNAPYATVAGGHSSSAQAEASTIAGGEGNAIKREARAAVIGGGQYNDIGTNASYAAILGGQNNRVRNTASGAFIGGGATNTIQNESARSVIGGGNNNTILNQVTNGVIAGGSENTIEDGARYSVIGGGQANGIALNSAKSTIGGGFINNVNVGAESATIGGGENNTVADGATHAVIGGGFLNNAGGIASTVPGGQNNDAANTLSFAAGNRAKAAHVGAFVWGDASDEDIVSTNDNSVTMRAAGGYRLFTDTNLASGAELASGSGSWTSLSDVNAKKNFEPVDGGEILDRLASMSIQKWTYKTQDDSIRHIGPTAQDFNGAFGVGDRPTGITGVDADGVALAAIQELIRQNRAQQDEIETLKREILLLNKN